jgi:outer membrane protein OmpA-like peptidoglycan-associated protein
VKTKSTIIAFIIGFLVVGSLVALLTLKTGETAPTPSQPTAEEKPAGVPDRPQVAQTDVPTPPTADKQQGLDFGKVQSTSNNLVYALLRILEGGEGITTGDLISHEIMSSEIADIFAKTLSQGRVFLKEGTPVTEVGKDGDTTRYRFNFSNGAEGFVDLARDEQGKWVVKAAHLPTGDQLTGGTTVVMTDALGVADNFVRAALASDYKSVRKISDPASVSDATLVGLCILFEEGKYGLRKRMPVRGMFSNDNNAGFLVYLADQDDHAAGTMGLTLKKTPPTWLVSQVALDSLLADYASRFSDGETVYVPIVKNPKGGDSLALFFGFNEDTLTPRSLRQLQIVAEVIRSASDKKLEISGHTDDVGGEKYNQSLSERRADAVKRALVEYGVPAERIVTKGFGKSQPRRLYAGEDKDQLDQARRENRRAEMYLDF